MTDANVERSGAARDARDDRASRLRVATRAAGIVALALVIAALVTERLQPDGAVDRGFLATPFLWAIVLWFAVLAFDLVAFRKTQLQALERGPFIAACVVAALVWAVGMISYEHGSVAARAIFLIANALGVAMFWWAVFSLALLAVRRFGARIPAPDTNTDE